MTTPHDQYDIDEDGHGPYATLGAIDRDLERLGELTGAYVTDQKEDLSVAAARIPDEGQRREAEALLSRLRAAIEPHLDALDEATGPGPGSDQWPAPGVKNAR
jgi:hypothetical protein